MISNDILVIGACFIISQKFKYLEYIRELRNELHMSQEELSFKAGLSPAHLGQIERAIKNPTIDTIAKIAAALDVPIANLFTANPASLPPQNVTIGKINAQLTCMQLLSLSGRIMMLNGITMPQAFVKVALLTLRQR